jgi:hypothetical protein
LCSSQDPVKLYSRCALFQIINSNYFHYTHYVFTSRFVLILVLQITCGRTKAHLLPSLLIPWVISFILPCVLDGFHTSGTTIQMEVQLLDQQLERALWLGRKMLEVVHLLLLLIRLISAMNIHLNSNLEFWNNVYNHMNNSYNSDIISIIVLKHGKFSTSGKNDCFTLEPSACCFKLDCCPLLCSVHIKVESI